MSSVLRGLHSPDKAAEQVSDPQAYDGPRQQCDQPTSPTHCAIGEQEYKLLFEKRLATKISDRTPGLWSTELRDCGLKALAPCAFSSY